MFTYPKYRVVYVFEGLPGSEQAARVRTLDGHDCYGTHVYHWAARAQTLPGCLWRLEWKLRVFGPWSLVAKGGKTQ